ncbi:MAG TPA: type 1 glutamine amidotransferase domain-containing protein [Actinophytocola sp.]|uniref:type 1 glutamine amidotransferase domain-containing protein n=1 Tax=Actinophytocola sp. TaxID=1872138 RepID=UPI002DC01741|nr:type 1 glutamine amidotransferase domain-containing protein [Actinophytocola sp.]HEU5471746.1 type 1 glutamine amidotransferase domain-containing protein [Actinophytocola sp.]
MPSTIDGRKVAFLATDGVEQVELDRPWQAVRDAGGTPELVSFQAGEIQGFNHLDKADRRKVDRTLDEARAADYDALVLPGGVANGDFVRADERAVRFVRSFIDDGKPVSVICHGGWVLIEAGAVRGRRMTSWPSMKTDLTCAGADWVDEEVVVDRGLVSSRKPQDLDAFCAKTIEEIAEGRHAAVR